MKPENVPDEIFTQAGIVCTQLLICTHTPDIVQEILNAYMISLNIWMMQAGEHKLLIPLEMEELFSEWTVTTFRFVEPKDNILKQLRQWIDDNIELLYEIVAQQGRKHTICMTTDPQQDDTPLEKAWKSNNQRLVQNTKRWNLLIYLWQTYKRISWWELNS